MKKLRIVFVTPRFWPDIGGVERHAGRVAEELAKHNQTLTVLTSTLNRNLRPCDVERGIEICRYVQEIGSSEIRRLLNLLRMWVFLLRKLKTFVKFDIIHLHDLVSFLWILPLLPLLRGILKKPIFITFHGFEGYPIPKLPKTLRRVAEKVTDGNICVGSYITGWYGTNPNYITIGGVDLPQDPLDIPDENTALFIGRLAKDTGILQYVEALNLLKTKYGVNLTLHVCGDGPLRCEIESKKTAGSSIILHGFVENPEYFLRTCKFAFVSSYLAILEAMSYKRLVFSVFGDLLKRDYLHSISDADKLMIIASSPDELAGKLYNVLKDPQKTKQTLEKAYDFAKGRSWEKVAEMYAKLYSGRMSKCD